MAVPEEFLQPIPGDNPGGEDLYYDPVYDEIKEARRQELNVPQGAWERSRKVADFRKVVKLATGILAKRSKDLQVAAWLTEAWAFERGCEGFVDGLRLCRSLIEQFWDSLYPELEDGDAEFRATPLEWLGNYFAPEKGTSPALAVRHFALTGSGYSFLQFKESRAIPREDEAASNSEKQAARQKAVQEEKLLPEEFESDFERTPKPCYKELNAQLEEAEAEVRALDDLCTEKFGDVAPGFTALREALEEVKVEAHVLLQKKLETDPDPVELEEPAVEAAAEAVEGNGGAAAAAAPARVAAPEVAEFTAEELDALAPKNRNEAVKQLVAVARFLRRSEPASPVSYLLLRALRWGELRAKGPDVDLSILEAPSIEARMRLKQQAAAMQWQQVLETAESAMGGACGRGWLDLHRYVIRACEELGYTAVAQALRSELKCLLQDYPSLPDVTMKDDTGTANPETVAWFNEDLMKEEEAEG